MFTENVVAYVNSIDSALSDPDAWRGFRSYLETAFEMQAENCAFTDILTMSAPEAPGRLRPDFVHQDVALLLLATAGVINAARESAPEAWRWVAAISIEALQSQREQLPPAPSTQQLYRTFALERVQSRKTESHSNSH